MTEGGHGRQIKMSDIIPTDNSIPPLMGCLAFVPLYKDTRLLAGADDTSIQLDRNEPNIRRLERKLNVLQLIEQNRRFETSVWSLGTFNTYYSPFSEI